MDQKSFKPIYYLGNKGDFVSRIKMAIDEVDPTNGPLGDIFAGTGAVCAALSMERTVIASDIQEYSRVLCAARMAPIEIGESDKAAVIHEVDGDFLKQLLECLQPVIKWEELSLSSNDAERIASIVESPPLAVKDTGELTSSSFEDASQLAIINLKRAGLWESADTTVSRLFGGVYFSYRQAALLDSALRIASQNSHHTKDLLTGVALSTASVLVNTIGKQFAQPMQPRSKAGIVKSAFVRAAVKDRTINPVNTFSTWLDRYISLNRPRQNPIVLRNEFKEVVSKYGDRISVVYADPPYTRDHYSRFYHVLETMCLRDNPNYSTVNKGGALKVSRGLYRDDRFQSDFCVKSLAPKAFESLFKSSSEQGIPLVLSYSPHMSGDGTHPRVVSKDQLVALAREFYKKVEVETLNGSAHNIMNSAAMRLADREDAEIIIKCFVKG